MLQDRGYRKRRKPVPAHNRRFACGRSRREGIDSRVNSACRERAGQDRHRVGMREGRRRSEVVYAVRRHRHGVSGTTACPVLFARLRPNPIQSWAVEFPFTRRVSSLAKRWLLGAHQGSAGDGSPDTAHDCREALGRASRPGQARRRRRRVRGPGRVGLGARRHPAGPYPENAPPRHREPAPMPAHIGVA